ncbi:MAG: PAS domain S-box protein [Anaerolineae bacterium]|nr:PAS domain S-box protein [Anaerolineae bacterium]
MPDTDTSSPEYSDRQPGALPARGDTLGASFQNSWLQQALEESEQRYAVLFNQAFDAIILVDEHERILDANPAACRMLGYTRDELCTMSTAQLAAEQSSPHLPDPVYRRALEGTREGARLSLTLARRDGTAFPADVTITPLGLQRGLIFLAILRDMSERQQAARALADERNLLRTLIDLLPDYIYLKDHDGRYLLANSAVTKFLGVSSDADILGKMPADLFAPDQTAALGAADRAALESGQPVLQAEQKVRDAQGDAHTLLINKVPLRDSQGAIAGLVGIAHDITEHKRTEETLRHYAARLNVLYLLDQGVLSGQPAEEIAAGALAGFCALVPCHSAGLALFDAEKDNVLIVIASDYGETITNAGEHIALGQFGVPENVHALRRAIIPDLAEVSAPSALQMRLAQQGVRAYLSAPLVVEGHLLGELALGALEPGAFGAVHRVIATQLTDQLAIAMSHVRLSAQAQRHNEELQQRVAERTQELERTRSRVEAILNNTSDAIILSRADGSISQTNLTFDQLFGYLPDELFHHPLTEVAHPDSAAHFAQAIEQVTRQGTVQRLEIVARRKDGTTFDAEVALSLIPAGTGRRSGIICLLRDITERKRAEEELRRALEKERELSELKTRFVSMASHEFRTPLTTIVSSTEILERYLDRLQPAQREKHFRHIQIASRHMAQLLDDVLLLGRAEAEQLPFKPALLNLPALAAEVLEQVQVSAPPGIVFDVALEGACEYRLLDEQLMRHILTNLLSNAVKYSPKGGTVRYSVICAAEEITIRVQDEGIGIPEKDQERLYEPFHRASNVDTVQGTGLGLAITKHAVDLHGGTIVCDSAVGAGTTFTVRIPSR